MKKYLTWGAFLLSGILFAGTSLYAAYRGFFCGFIYSGFGLIQATLTSFIFILPCAYAYFKISNSKYKAIRLSSCMCLILYLLMLSIVLFGLRYSFEGIQPIGLKTYVQYNSNLQPFYTISQNIASNNEMAIMGNVILFVPLGFLAPLVCRRIDSYPQMAIFLLASITLVEVLQIVTRLGSFDVDDIILNFIGGMAGYFLVRQSGVIRLLNKTEQ
ncbi:MAG: VanZ family protein [Oscillibacter sp.]|nr:VanZ family protein [Oscillibacter sp.]